MELLGTSWDAEGLAAELLKDKSYFDASGGGITVSGGEATLQAEFVTELLKIMNRRGVHTAIDTCGLCQQKVLDTVLPYADLVLFDINISIRPHRELTGSGNEKILGNLKYITCFMKDHIRPRELWIRTPIIPGATDTEENIRGIGAFIAGLSAGSVARWELCAFNNLCRDKYSRLGKKWEFSEAAIMRAEEMEALAGAARDSGVDPSIVIWSGPTRMEESGRDADTAAVKH
jgi:pyruvate formate lyase activating enzyme